VGDLLVNVPIIEQTYSRSEVLVGPERRRRWSPAEKRQIVAASLAPGAVSSPALSRGGTAFTRTSSALGGENFVGWPPK